MNDRRDEGVLSILIALIVTVSLLGGALIVDGGRALAARRHAANTAASAARFAVSSQSLTVDADNATFRARALSYTSRSGVSDGDVVVLVDRQPIGVIVTVTVTEQTTTAFLALAGASSITVHATASARFVYSS